MWKKVKIAIFKSLFIKAQFHVDLTLSPRPSHTLDLGALLYHKRRSFVKDTIREGNYDLYNHSEN